MLSAHGTVTIRPKEVVPVYREEWDARVTDYKYNLVNRDFVSRNGNLYQVKVQRPNEFIPAGIDPDSEVGEAYWEAFNKLAPSVANFLIIVDEDGKPQTLLSGGRIQARFLNIGSLNMGETRLWGGAEPMTGKGLALINDPGDRKFVVYNDADNYIEMFMREKDTSELLKTGWGFRGVVDGKEVFQLGYSNERGSFIGPFGIGVDDLTGHSDKGELSLKANAIKFVENTATGHGYAYLGVAGGGSYSATAVLEVQNGDIWHQGYLHGEGRACRFYASDIIARGLLELRSHVRFDDNAYESALPYLWTYSNNGTIPTANRRLVYVQGNTGGDNPCKLGTSGAVDGQVITIVNTSTSHRVNITGTAKGNHWILEGCCGSFRFLSGYGLWYPERFDW
nr:MAG TPA: hypothetical protein [Caudoviricetes sp.]